MIATRCPQEDQNTPSHALVYFLYHISLLFLSYLESWVKRESVGLKI